jgi:urease accessory protein
MPVPSIATAMTTETAGLYRLLAWASPAFPTGAFSYSHGLETAAADGTVRDRATLQSWIAAIVTHGSGRIDADIVRDAWRAAVAGGDEEGLGEANRRGCAYRATAELALESSQQGAAFLAAYEAAWTNPHPPVAEAMGPTLSRTAGEGAERSEAGEGHCHAAVFGAAAAHAGIALGDTLTAYLQAFAANLMSAGLRLGIVGQSDGQRILAALEPVVEAGVVVSLARGTDDFGAATFAVDLASMVHETQYTRLFRS